MPSIVLYRGFYLSSDLEGFTSIENSDAIFPSVSSAEDYIDSLAEDARLEALDTCDEYSDSESEEEEESE